MNSFASTLAAALAWAYALCPPASALPRAGAARPWFLKSISLPESLSCKPRRTIKIAVVDDAFRLSHEAIKNHVWTNPGEIPGNGIDDDGNGYIDDVHGWDVSDDDGDVSPPADRWKDYYHGTHNAGIIAAIAEAVTPRGGSYPIEIIPVKCLSDRADKTYLKDAYKGIEYAIRAGADIISCSWSGGPLGAREAELLKLAEAKGILVVASAGNFNGEDPQYPAAAPGVLAVAALDSADRKWDKSNYGSHIAISAPGEAILSPSALSDTSYEDYAGTSAAAPQVAAVAALGMLAYPQASLAELLGLMKNTAVDEDALNPRYAGKLGAGKLNAAGFLREGFPGLPENGARMLAHSHGAILFHKEKAGLGERLFGKKAAAEYAWQIRPAGTFTGLRFRPSASREARGVLSIVSADSGRRAPAKTFRLDSLPAEIFVAGSRADIRFLPENPGRACRWSMAYEPVTIDSSTLYCRDRKNLEGPEGAFTDGSGDAAYAGGSDCKWLMTAPPGQVVELSFPEFDTEAKSDLVYVFDGSGTQERILGIFSGPNLPPTVVSSGNTMLVWFVTDGVNQGRGWSARYHFSSPPTAKP